MRYFMSKGTSKYDPLRDYLMRSRWPHLLMTLDEIEAILGFRLCKSARKPFWWANTSYETGRSQRRAWGDAGYDAYLTPTGDTVEFLKRDADGKSQKRPKGFA